MPFLLPALSAAVCDVIVCYLSRHEGLIMEHLEDSQDESRWIYRSRYMYPLAILRLFLLMVPLPYHSYTGTAVKCPMAYQLLYGGSILILLLHMLSLSMLDPSSLNSFLPQTTTAVAGRQRQLVYDLRLLFSEEDPTTGGGGDGWSSNSNRRARQDIWLLLTCSLISNLCHWILFLHVRSTAPATAEILRRQRAREKVLFYLLKEQREEANENNNNIHPERLSLLSGGSSTNGNITNGNHQHHPYQRNINSNNQNETFPPLTRRDSENSANSINRMQRMTNEFMLEIQAQIQKTKLEWTKRLDDYRTRTAHHHYHHHGSGNGLGGGSGNGSSQDLLHRPLTPFRVILQLFAYEDVLTNGRLDAVYDQDDGVALLFFIPQLLSFLLHGAYDSSPQLEEWLLDTCRRNIYFAHRCYWFLRAWCLESTHDAAVDQSTRRLSRTNSFENYSSGGGGGGGSFGGSLEGTAPSNSTTMVHEDAAIAKSLERLHLSATSLSSMASGNGNNNNSSGQHEHHTHDKLSPEERAVLEGLMIRIVECAEDTARLLNFGSGREWEGFSASSALPHSYHHNGYDGKDSGDCGDNDAGTTATNWVDPSSNFSSPSALMLATEAGAIPIDPQTGVPSAKHWDCVAAGDRKFGFLPLDRALTNASTSTTNTPTKPPPAPRPHHDPLHPPKCTIAEPSSYFDSTPVFFDALLTIAENLFKVPREQRIEDFHRQLRNLEVQMLPSNSIYVPVQKNFNHRVWRIVAEESIAISTKERVPCIICLEVVDYPRDEVPTTRDVRHLLDRAASAGSKGGSSTSGSGAGGGAANSARPISPGGGRDSTHQNLTTVGVGNGPLSTFRYSSTLNEKELVHHWRYGYRDPHRQDTAFEKLAYSMRDGIRRIPLDQMKTQMKAHIKKLRNTQSNFHDLLTLHMPETFSDDDDDNHSGSRNDGSSSMSDKNKKRTSPDVRKMESLQSNDIERGTKPGKDSLARNDGDFIGTATNASGSTRQGHEQKVPAPPPPPPTPPRSPPIARTTMGQWTSPQKFDDRIMGQPNLEDELDASLMIPPTRDLQGRARLDYASATTSTTEDNGSRQHRQVYGSRGPLRTTDFTSPITSPVQQASSRKDTRTPPRTPAKPPPVVFKENWRQKEERLRSSSVYGSHPGWRLLPLLIKGNDDLRQEQLASQLIYRMSLILARENVPVWLCPYEILATTDRGGIIEAIPDTISIASLKKNDPTCPNLKDFFARYFVEVDDLADAKANFCESLAAYSMVCFFLQIKDRHNGNILLDNRGHLIHIDFGFFFLSSPGKNTGFESAPFKLTRDFVDLLEGPDSRLFRTFRVLCYRTFIALRRHCMEIILLVEMLKKGNEELPCFRGRPDDAIKELRQRFRLDLNDRACIEYVNALVDESLENWRTNWYDRYQRYCVGIL